MKRVPLWLPYVEEFYLKKKDTLLYSKYKGGILEEPVANIHSILIYGSSSPLRFETIDALARKGIPILLHRRNIAKPVWIHSFLRPDNNDMLTLQILCRANEHKKKHIVKKLLKAKFRAMSWLLPVDTAMLRYADTIAELRQQEAQVSKKYWEVFFEKLDKKTLTRRGDNEARTILDAVSKFAMGISLRWVHYHHLSPFHGFLHEPTTYPALCYDMIEPYRPIYDKWLFDLFLRKPDVLEKKKLDIAINLVKDKLKEQVYTDLTRQIVTYHELYHGAILGLRSYLLGSSAQFMIPMPDVPNGGRPRSAGFRLYGKGAGKTNFWAEAETVSKSHPI